MPWGILLMLIMLRADWKKASNEKTEGNRILIRAAVTFVAVLLMGDSFVAAVLIGAAWGVIGGVIFSMIGESRNAGKSNSANTITGIPQTQEYLVNGQGQLTNRVFNANEYSGYTEVERNSEGRILADAAGKIICTRYVRK